MLDLAFIALPCEALSNMLVLCRTPPQLLKTIDAVLGAYDSSRGSDSMAGQAGSLMNPLVIERMRALQGVIRSEFT